MSNMTDRKRINVYIPMGMYVKVTQSEYNLTDAIVKGLDLVLSDKPINNESINIQLYENRIKDLQVHNDTLKKELETIQNMYNNYMLQVQTIINQRAIEEPKQKKWFEFWK
jgi:uncharacterized protein YwgA